MSKRSRRSLVLNPITCWSVMRSVSTPRGMKRPQPKKAAGTFRPLERGLEDGFKCDERRCLRRLIQKLLQRWRRCGGAAAETGANDGTASTRERLVHTHAGVQHAAKIRGAAHAQPRDALGVRAGRRTVSPHHPSAVCGETAGGGPD